MPQNDYMDLHKKRFGLRLDTEERLRKKEARSPHEISKKAQTLTGIKVYTINQNYIFDKHRQKYLIRKDLRKRFE